jgi:predicted RNA-binding Zn-ribbon protein involved in translation (DUF1610 family)
MQGWLLRAGMLRRNEHPAEAEMRELLPAAAPKLACPQCGERKIAVAEGQDLDDAAWDAEFPIARRCESCGGPIQPERLEVFPDAELCVACQRRVDAHLPQQTDEYCDRCGWPLEVRASRGRGVSGKVMACSNPDCRGARAARH